MAQHKGQGVSHAPAKQNRQVNGGNSRPLARGNETAQRASKKDAPPAKTAGGSRPLNRPADNKSPGSKPGRSSHTGKTFLA